MGRTGGGGGRVGGGGFSGGGHHSSSHSGGGHRSSFGGSSSSSRTGSSRSGSSWSGSSHSSSTSWSNSTRKTTPPPPKMNAGTWNRPPTANYGGGFGGNFGGGYMNTNRRKPGNGGCVGCSSVLAVIVVIIIMMIIVAALFGSMGGGRNYDYGYTTTVTVPASSYNREKLEGTTWSNNCVVDETGWISDGGSVSGLERQLRKFYDKTGIQPYVYLVRNPSLKTTADMEQFAYDYYENNINNTYTFALFCFAEDDLDGTKYEYYEGGSQALGIMDSEAVDIFWAIFDQEWYNESTSTEDCIANIFNRTADRIMTRSATKTDVAKVVAIIVLVVVIAAAIIIIMNKRRKNERERNEETKRILETPLE